MGKIEKKESSSVKETVQMKSFNDLVGQSIESANDLTKDEINEIVKMYEKDKAKIKSYTRDSLKENVIRMQNLLWVKKDGIIWKETIKRLKKYNKKQLQKDEVISFDDEIDPVKDDGVRDEPIQTPIMVDNTKKEEPKLKETDASLVNITTEDKDKSWTEFYKDSDKQKVSKDKISKWIMDTLDLNWNPDLKNKLEELKILEKWKIDINKWEKDWKWNINFELDWVGFYNPKWLIESKDIKNLEKVKSIITNSINEEYKLMQEQKNDDSEVKPY